MKKKKIGKREREKGKRRGRGGARQRRPRLRSATRDAGGGARGRRREGKGGGGIRGGRSRRVALDRKEMRRGLKSGVGSDLRGLGDRSRRVSGKLGFKV